MESRSVLGSGQVARVVANPPNDPTSSILTEFPDCSFYILQKPQSRTVEALDRKLGFFKIHDIVLDLYQPEFVDVMSGGRTPTFEGS
tara:strand:- start:42 stop:302 length:261 start_codon:yes stop_codon:yes gene_type:complete